MLFRIRKAILRRYWTYFIHGKIRMAKTIKQITISVIAATFLAAVLYRITAASWLFSVAITFGTAAYHFVMRLVTGGIVNAVMHNKADLSRRWYQISNREQKFYRMIRVKKWKKNMPSYNPSFFDPGLHSWQEIAQAMCQSEITHEIICIFSFIPLIFTVWFGAFPVFLITSLLAALIDLLFVIMQRYNRPRIMRLIHS